MAEPLKNLYSEAYIDELALAFKNVYHLFDDKHFKQLVLNRTWAEMELKQRMRHITENLHACLPFSYPKQIEILVKVAPQFNGFTAMFFPDFVALYGLQDWNTSLPALAFFTQYSSSEFAVRPFIKHNQAKMIEQHLAWSKHKNHHVRRLASEGIRPRLPWAEALPNFKKNPTPILAILENLKADQSEYVRKSVANCLNDISKDHPELTLTVAKKWLGKNAYTNHIVKHACRGLLKQGNTKALSLFNIDTEANIKLSEFNINKTELLLGEEIGFGVCLKNLEQNTQHVRLEYRIYFMKKNGKLSPKIFQWSKLELQAGEQKKFEKHHKLIDLTTRKHYTGMHQIAIVINGQEAAKKSYQLLPTRNSKPF